MCHKITKLDYLYEMGGEDVSFIIEMIDLFLAQSDEVINEINQQVQNKDIEGLKRTLHKLKSTANLFQITDLIEVILAFELNNKEPQNEDTLSVMMNEIIEILLTAKKQLGEEKTKLFNGF